VHSFGQDSSGHPILGNLEYPQPYSESTGNWLILEWADPWNCSTNDYDLFLVDPSDLSVVGSSTNPQICSSHYPPHEYISGGAAGYQVYIVKHSSAASVALQLNTGRAELQYGATGAVWGHFASKDAVTVGAADVYYTNGQWGGGTIFTGGSANPIDIISSDGPRPMFFDPSGNLLNPNAANPYTLAGGGATVLNKIDITAADGVHTAVPLYDPFGGTSAAAPHGAAMGALLKSANPYLTNAHVVAALKSTALRVTANGDQPNGVATATQGAGIAMINLAVASVFPQITITSNPPGPELRHHRRRLQRGKLHHARHAEDVGGCHLHHYPQRYQHPGAFRRAPGLHRLVRRRHRQSPQPDRADDGRQLHGELSAAVSAYPGGVTHRRRLCGGPAGFRRRVLQRRHAGAIDGHAGHGRHPGFVERRRERRGQSGHRHHEFRQMGDGELRQYRHFVQRIHHALGKQTKLTFTSAKAGASVTTAGKSLATQTLSNGNVRVQTSGASQTALASGVVAYATLTLSAQFTHGAATPLTLLNCTSADGQGTALSTTCGVATVESGWCDINADGVTTVADVQLIIDQALGMVQAANDLNWDGIVNVVEVQMVINATLGLGCPY
jgi:hypothetical protein